MKGFASLVLILGVILVPVLAKDPRLDLIPFETAPGPCPKPKTVIDFDPTKLAGTWYDIKRYKNTVTKGSCGTMQYTWFPNNSSFVLSYAMKEYDTRYLDLRPVDIYRAKFKTKLPVLPTSFGYWFVGTDYDNFHIAYSCVELVPLILNSQTINIASRTPIMDPKYLGEALAILQKNKLDATILRDVVQDATTCGRN